MPISVYSALLALIMWLPCQAQAAHLDGKWFRLPPDWTYAAQEETALIPVDQPDRTGGRFLYRAEFDIGQAETLVLDFKNSSVIGLFHHRVFDRRGHLVAEAEGGIQSDAPNPFFLRHGRELKLPAGHYRLATEVSSPFLLAQPVPYLDTLEDYRQAINPGNALTLLCLGLLLGLLFYYSALAAIRRNSTDALYALFILGNLLYNGTALLVYPELLGMHWFYLISFPILFSNAAYALFVLRLLDITHVNSARLHRVGMALTGLLAASFVLALLVPRWSLELDRLGVALFLSFGLLAGAVRARQGHPSARMYLVAVTAFFALGSLSISLSRIDGLDAFYVEHLGLFAVTVEALLLALVLARQFEQLRAEKERAITESFDKSRFLAAASHDLRQPMHALGLFVGELREHVHTPHQTLLVKLIEESANAMSGLLDSLLDVSKLDAGLVVPRIQPVAIIQLLRRMGQEYVPLATNQGVSLKIPLVDAIVESDAVLLERILLNLLGNAIRYTPNGGRVLLACRRRGKRLRIEVRDNGIGIPLDRQKDIFREFVQLDNAARSREKGLGLGLGLGLSIVQRLCRLLSHPLSLRAAPGRGSVFAIEVPLAQPTPCQASHATMRLPLESRLASSGINAGALPLIRVLIVEDDQLVLTGTQSLLESWGCKVRAAASLVQARQLISSLDFDLLICDYLLPDGNGMQVIQAARQSYHKQVPSILISGETTPEVLQEVTAQGLHLLHKPVQPAKLHSLLLFISTGEPA